MAEKNVKIVLSLDGKQYSAELQRAGQQVQQFGTQASASLDRASAGAQALTGHLARMGHAAMGALAVNKLVDMADAVTTLNNTLRLATGSSAAAGQAYTALFDIAQRSRVSFTELGATFASLNRAGSEMGVSQQRMLAVTEAIGNAMTISGGSAQSMQAALIQLGQGMSSGVLRGEELNSVMEQAPRLAKALADGLGVPIGKLREMGAAGQITAEQVVRALESQAAVLRGEVAGATLTVSQGWTQLSNATLAAVGEFDKATGASSALAGAISSVASGVTTLGAVFRDNEVIISTTLGVLGGAATAAGVARVASAITGAGGMVAAIGAVRVAFLGLTAAAAANPIGLALLGIGAVVGGAVAAGRAYSKTEGGIQAAIEQLKQENERSEAALQRAVDGGRMAGADNIRKAIEGRKKAIADLNAELALMNSQGLDTSAEDARLARHTQAMKAAQKDAESLAKLQQELDGVPPGYVEKMQEVIRLNQAGVLTGKAYTDALGKLQAELLKKTSASKDGAAASKQELNAYQELMAAIAAKLQSGQAELVQGRALTESQKLQIKLDADLAQGKLKLTPVHEAAARAAIAELAAQERRRAVLEGELKLAQLVAEARQDELRGIEALMHAQQEAAQKSLQSVKDRLTSLEEEERAAALAAAQNISLAEAVERVAIARLREEQTKFNDIEGGRYQEIEKEIAAREKLLGVIGRKEAREALKKTADEAAQELKRVTEQYEQGLINAAMQGGQSLKDYITGMLRATAFRIVLQPVMSGMAGVLAGVSGSGTAAGASGGLAGLVNAGSAIYSALTNGISGSISAAFGKFATSAVGQTLGLSTAATVGNNASAYVAPQLTGVGSAIGTGLGMLGSGFAGYGLSKAISGGYTTGGNTVNVLSGIASAFVGPLAGVVGGLINRAFGRKLKDMGVEGTLGGADGFAGSAYQFYKGGWLRSDKTTHQDLDPATAAGLAESFKAIQGQVGAFATALGLQTDKIASFTTALKVSTNGLDEAGIQAAFQEALAKGSNELAQQVLGTWTHVSEQVTEAVMTSGATDAADAVFEQVTRTITSSSYAASEYAKTGEEAIDTLSRLANSFTAVNALSDAMGYGFHAASLAGANAASRIADAFGGLEALTQSLGAYVTNYYTDTEQRAATARQASRALADVGLDFSAERLLTATRPQIRAFVEGVLAEFGAESTQYVAAVNQANALAAITEPLQTAAQSMAASTTAATDALREYEARIKAIADERKSLRDELDELTMTRLELLAKERAAIDSSNQALWDQLQAARDAKVVADERKGLQDELNGLADTAAQALQRQRDALHESNRALFDQVEALRLQQQLLAEVPALIDKYTTDAQRQAASYARIAADLGAAGIGVSAETLMGATKAQIAEAVLAIHAMGSTSDETRLALVRAASGLSDLKDAATAAANTAADSALSSLQRSIEAEKAAITEAANARIDALRKEAEAQKAAQETAAEALATATRVADSLGRAVRTLRGQVESTALQELAAARRFIEDAARTAAATGVLPDEDALARAIESVTADNQQRYGTYADWEAAQLDQANQLAALGAVGELQMTVAERQLAATKGQAVLIEEQIKATQDGATAATRALDQQLQAAQERLAVLRDSNAVLKSIAESSAGFEAALARLAAAQSASAVGGGGGGAGTPSGATGGSGVLNGPMGSQYDPRSDTFYAGGSGLPYSGKDLGAAAVDMVNAGQARELYDLAVANGVTAAMLGQWTGASAADLNAWAREQGLPAFAQGTNYVPRDMLALIHEGEEIVPKRYNPAAQGGAWAPASTISRNMAARSDGAESALQAVVATLAGAVDRLASSNGNGALAAEDRNNLKRVREVLEGAALGRLNLGVKAA